MTTDANQDEEHLRLLSIFHYIVGGLMAFFGCIPLVHFGLGVALLTGRSFFGNGPEQQPPVFIGLIFMVFGLGVFVIFQGIAVCTIIAGWKLAVRRAYKFAFVTACLDCIFMPFGTVLGVLTIIVLSRPSVKALFGVPAPITSPPPLAGG